MTVKHLRIDVEAYKPAPSAEIMAEALKSRIKSVVEQEANLEIDPAVIEDERTLVVSLRLRRDRPLKQAEVRQCEDLLPFVLRIISALSLPWQAIRIYETITYEAEGAVAGGAVGGAAGVASKSAEAALLLAIVGGLVGYMLGDVTERVSRDLCEFANVNGFPVISARYVRDLSGQ